MVVVSPDDYKILAASDAYLNVTMRSLDDIVGKRFLIEAFPDRSIAYEENPVKKSLDKALQTKKPDHLNVIRYDIPKPEAEGGGYDIRYWEASHSPVLNNQGEVEYIIQHTSDVTDREMARMALSESEEKFRFMAETMPQLIFTTNASGQLTYLNQRWENYTGIPVKVLLHDGWRDIIHPDDLPVIEARWQKAYQNLDDYQAEMRKKHKDGQYRWHLCRALPMLDEKGNVLMWVGNCTDIHDTRQMVEELVTTNEEMARLSDQVQVAYSKAESERKTLERLIIKAPAFFCILKGPDHRYELVNDNYQRLFPNRQLLHKTVAEAVPEVIEQGFIKVLDDVYQTGKDFVADKITVKLDQHNTGQLEDVKLSFIYQPLADENDKIYGILVCGFEVPKND